MRIKYDLNLKIYEIGVVLDNVAKWKGLLELRDYIERYSNILNHDEYEMFKYGIFLITEGNDPQDVQFLLSEELEQIKIKEKENQLLHKNLRLIIKIINWLQQGPHQCHTILLEAIDDEELRTQYKNWIGVNEFDTNITFEESKGISTQEWLRIRDSNQIVKSYHDNQMKANNDHLFKK